MKRFGLLIMSCVLAGLTACSSTPKPATNNVPASDSTATASIKDSLKTPVDRYSYALGMDVGKTLKSILVDINMDALNLAMAHQMEGKPSLMTEEEAESALETLLLQVQEKREQTAKEDAEKEKTRQAEFLAKNKLDSSVIVTASGLQYKIIKEGQGLSPKRTEKVKVHYVGSLLDGKEFDNSIKRGEPLTFDVANVIEGWQELLTLMKPGMKVKAWIPSNLAYGEEGAEPIIPRNALLIFGVELLEVFAEPAPVDSVSKPAVQTEAKPEVKTEAKPEVKTEAKPEVKAEVKPAAKTEAKPAAKTEAKPEVKAEAKPAAKTEAKPEVKAEVKPAAKTEAKPAAKTEAKPEAKTEAKPEVKAEAKPAAKTEAKPAAKTEAKPAVKAEAKPEVKTEAKPEVKAEAKPAAKTEAKSEVKTEAKPAAKTEAKPAAKTEKK